MKYPMTILARREELLRGLENTAMPMGDSIKEAVEEALPKGIAVADDKAEIHLWGSVSPGKMVEYVSNWNIALEYEAIRLTTDWLKKPAFDGSDCTEVITALRLANNRFSLAAKRAMLYDNGCGYNHLCTRISENVLAEVSAYPERFCLASVTLMET